MSRSRVEAGIDTALDRRSQSWSDSRRLSRLSRLLLTILLLEILALLVVLTWSVKILRTLTVVLIILIEALVTLIEALIALIESLVSTLIESLVALIESLISWSHALLVEPLIALIEPLIWSGISLIKSLVESRIPEAQVVSLILERRISVLEELVSKLLPVRRELSTLVGEELPSDSQHITAAAAQECYECGKTTRQIFAKITLSSSSPSANRTIVGFMMFLADVSPVNFKHELKLVEENSFQETGLAWCMC